MGWGGNRNWYMREVCSTLESDKYRKKKKAGKGEEGSWGRGGGSTLNAVGRGGPGEKQHVSRDLKTMQR